MLRTDLCLLFFFLLLSSPFPFSSFSPPLVFLLFCLHILRSSSAVFSQKDHSHPRFLASTTRASIFSLSWRGDDRAIAAGGADFRVGVWDTEKLVSVVRRSRDWFCDESAWSRLSRRWSFSNILNPTQPCFLALFLSDVSSDPNQ